MRTDQNRRDEAAQALYALFVRSVSPRILATMPPKWEDLTGSYRTMIIEQVDTVIDAYNAAPRYRGDPPKHVACKIRCSEKPAPLTLDKDGRPQITPAITADSIAQRVQRQRDDLATKGRIDPSDL